MSVAIILLSHEPNDCIYQYNIAYSLRKAGWQCDLYSACNNHLEEPDSHTYTFDGVSLPLKERAKQIKTLLKDKHYSIAICDTPLGVSFARQYADKVIYYITEWYPSKKNLRGLSCIGRLVKFQALVLASLWAGIRADAFFFGESYKARPFRMLFPWKRYFYIPYYPRLDIFPPVEQDKKDSVFTFLYAGPLTAEKGWERVKRLVKAIADKYPRKQWKLLVLSDNTDECTMPDNLTVSFEPYQPYRTFCNMLHEVDLCLDLRDDDYENTHCLPIKLFHYIAAPANVLYTDLKAIHKDAPALAKTVALVRPDDAERQLEFVSHIADSPSESLRAFRQAFEQEYNWDCKEEPFLSFIKKIQQP